MKKFKKNIILQIILINLIWFNYSSVFAVGAPNYYPDGTHPRLYLSSEIMATLNEFKNSNTTEWQALKNWCDDHIGENVSSGYQGAEWAKFAKTYALCYRMTNVESYATESIIYLEAMLDDSVSNNNGTINDNAGGAISIQTDSGYTARLIGVAVPLTRDWLAGSNALTPEIIERITVRMKDWINWYSANGYQRHEPQDNYYGGYFEMVYTTALALYGDVGYDNSWLTKARTMWINDVLPIINGGEFDPADSMEGWSYYPHHALSYIKYPVLSAMAQGYDDWNSIGNWHTDILNTVIHMLRPDRNTMFDDGVWDSTAMSGVSDSINLIDFLGTFTPLNITKKGIARWYVVNLGATRSIATAMEAFLYHRPADAIEMPTLSNMGSLVYKTKGNVIGRSAEWSDVTATWFSVTAWDGDLSEGGRSAGEFKLFSRGEYLIPDGTYTSFDGKYSNILSATGNHRYSPFQDWDATNIKTDIDTIGSTTIINISGLEDVYDTVGYGKTLAQYHRCIVQLSADIFVVIDNAQPINASTIKRRWHFFSSPIISEPIITATVGAATVSIFTVGNISSPIALSGYPTREGTFYVDVDTANATLFQIGDNGFVPEVVTQDMSGDVQTISVGNNIVIYATSDNAMISGGSYSTDSIQHTIVDLPTNTEISIVRDGVDIINNINSGNVGAISFTAPAGLANYIITIGTSNSICYPDLDSDLYPGIGSESVQTCSTNYHEAEYFTSMTIDCNDNDSAIHPNAPDICGNGIAENCVADVDCSTEIRADVDQNSSINSTDAMLTLRNSLGLDMSGTNWQASSTTGDVNCDDVTNSTDAMLILRQSLGLDMGGTGWCE